jgi:holo-[acyl-carrier protein] synthase
VIFGIGTDIVEVQRIEASLDRFGERFANKILTAFEMERYQQSKFKVAFLAKHFASKEACAKAFGTGFSNGIGLHTIELHSEPAGRPFIVCLGKAQQFMDANSLWRCHLSIADERRYAVAHVVVERQR